MSPEVLERKLEHLQGVLTDLKPHLSQTRGEQWQAHYEIERLVQLAADLSVAIGRRLLLLEGRVSQNSARDVFDALAKAKVIPAPLARALANAAALRNLLVHEYGEIDYQRFFGGLKAGYRSFHQFASKSHSRLLHHQRRR